MRAHPFLPFFRHRPVVTGPSARNRAPVPVEGAPRPAPAPGRQLADEAEAFLAGTLAELIAGQEHTPPAWTLINRLAHGEVYELRRLSRGHAMPIDIEGACATYERAWAQAERSLAIRMLDMCAGADQVELMQRLQRDVLVPLELDLIGSSAGSPPLGAVVIAAAQALDEHRPDH